jgi:UDP-glucose 4-epimerase
MSIICILGGLGYIGSHIALKYLSNNLDVLLIDNLSNSCISVFNNIETAYKNAIFRNCDINNRELLANILLEYKVTTIIYAFRDSFTNNNNYISNYEICNRLLSIFEAIDKYNCINNNYLNKLIFASNIDIYTSNKELHLEDDSFNITHPCSFLICLKEKMISDYYILRKHISTVILRLAVPVGGHSIFYDIYSDQKYINNNQNLQNNLIGYYFYNNKFNIYGCNYNTVDGSNNVNLLSIFDIGDAFLDGYVFLNSQTKICKTYNIANNNVNTIIQFIKTLQIYNDKNKIENSIRFYILNKTTLKNTYRHYSIELAANDLKWRPIRSIFIDTSELIYGINYNKKNKVVNNTQSNYLYFDSIFDTNSYILLDSNETVNYDFSVIIRNT